MAEQVGNYVGTSVLRKEDAALLTGGARWTDNIKLPSMLHVAVLRSPLAHAKISRIDVSGALSQDGVVAAYTGEDLAEEWPSGIPCAWQVTQDMKTPVHWPVARSEVNHMGDAVAVVVASESRLAHDALEAIDVYYEPLEPVVDVERALAEDAPLVHEELGTNECYTWPLTTGDIGEAFERADVVTSGRYIQQRLIPSPIETRAVVAQQDPVHDGFILHTSTQVPHFVKDVLAGSCGVPDNKLRVIAPDVGGGFGGKLNVYAEEALALALTRRLGVPIKWNEDRGESHQASTHGRGQVQYVEIAARNDGSILGMKVKLYADMGAYLQLLTPGVAVLGSFTYPGLYTFDAYSFECTGVFTNLTPTDSYRGAGRSEAAYACERAMDDLARELGMDPAEVRLKNLMPPFDEPVTNPAGVQYDSGDYETSMRKALDLVGYEDLREEQRSRREAGGAVQLGIGIGNFTESGGLSPSKISAAVGLGGAGWEAATVRMLPSGRVEVITGTSPHGQGHATSWSQIVADALGVHPDEVEVHHGDTAIAPWGRDTYGSRSLSVGGVAVHLACEKVADKAKKIAAHMLEAAESDVEFSDGRFSVAGSQEPALTIQEIAGAAFAAADLPEGMEPGLTADYFFDPPNFTWPFGTHICITEVDTETGGVTIPKYVAVDDCGPVVNPQVVEGQLHGGIAQGIAQALYEEATYDESGTLTSASLMDYMIPGAPEIPRMILDHTVTPSSTNPMGVKGIGESGSIGASPAVINSVIDALSPLGVTHVDMPASPMRVWEAIQAARKE